MQLTLIDLVVIALYGAMALIVGIAFTRRAGTNRQEFFLAGRQLPWWLLGTSMVATTFSTDTPNLVTDIVRTNGVSGNWVWWAFLVTGMLTVFFYAKLWRRSGVLTDMAFYELRYGGKPAAFLRGFRALYLGVFFNIMIMATVTLAAIKIGGVLLGLQPWQVVVLAGTVTVIYSATSGLWGVVVTDLMLFVIAMIGAVSAAYYALAIPEVGGLDGLLQNPALAGKLSFLPDFTDWHSAVAIFIVPLAVQWWATWYPGSEPGGGGYQAQRMLAARSEEGAMGATLWFNIAHYALRPWPWILVGLASLIVYPTLESIAVAFPHLDPSIIRHDLAYPAMLVFIPHGLLGLVVASLAAAYMSTISTHLNWGASYVVNDYYRRFVAGERSEHHYVAVGRATTVALIVIASALSLWLTNALQAFQILLQIGAGTGLVFILRWFWWRINAWSEISAMVISFAVAVYFQFVHEAIGMAPMPASSALVIGVGITTAGWLIVTFLTPPEDTGVLQRFYDAIRPFGHGWKQVVEVQPESGGTLSAAVACWALGCAFVYGSLFGTGYLIYGQPGPAAMAFVVVLFSGLGVFRLLPKVGLR
jgi:SSS family solute:Na+ symporter